MMMNDGWRHIEEFYMVYYPALSIHIVAYRFCNMHVDTANIWRATSERATTTRQWKYYVTRCFHNILSSLLPSVTPPPHTNVAISRRADDDDDDDDDNKQATVREWTKIRHNKQSRVVVCGTDLLIATNNTHRYYIIFIMIVTYYYVGPWLCVEGWWSCTKLWVVIKQWWKWWHAVSQPNHVLSLLIKCRDEGPLNKEMRHWCDNTNHGRLTTNYYDPWSLTHNK